MEVIKKMSKKDQCLIVPCRALRPKQSLTKTRCNVRWLAILTVLPIAMLIFTGYGGSSSALPSQGVPTDSDTLRIQVTLDEFSISPNPLRIPAGRPVTLVIKNVGRVSHELMAGRESQGDDFERDLFAGLDVEISNETAAGDHDHAESPAEEHEAASDHEHGEAQAAEHEHAEDESAEHGDDHGTMVQPGPGQTFYISFTLPESRRGEWNTACFLPGHYAAGMHGTLIVE
jgi:uncharacterized cupredoxin-like copper-binding protein